MAHHRAGELGAAERLYRAVLQANPRHGYGWMALGALLGSQGRLQEALPVLLKSVELLPADPDAHGNLANALRDLGRLSEALPVLQNCIVLRPLDPLLHNDMGNALLCLGRPVEAQACLRRALDLDPGFGEAHCNLGLVRRMLGHLPDAEAHFRRAIELNPGLSEAYNNLGSVLQDLGRPSEAETAYRRALERRPDYHEAHVNLGGVLRDLRRFAEAEASYHRALNLRADIPDTHCNLAFVLYDLGRLGEAEASCREALKIDPDFSEAHCNLGLVHHKLGRLPEAEAHFRRAIELNPGLSEAYNNLGSVLPALGRLPEAEAACRRALELRPGYHEAYVNLGNVLRELRRFEEAEASYRRALEFKSDFAGAHGNLAILLHELRRLSEAEASCREALRLDPDFSEAHFNLANVLRSLGRFSEAEASYRRALELRPDYHDALINLGHVLGDLRRFADAEASYHRALELKPDSPVAHSALLFLMAHSGVGTAEGYLARARNAEIAVVPEEERAAAKAKRFVRSPRRGRALRIGYVSGDLGAHVVSLNMEGVLKAHDRRRVEVFAFPTSGIEDVVTDRIRQGMDHWLPLLGLSDHAAVDLISAQRIDVLVDLSGHTAHNRLGVFARRAAPIQCHYLGYFASTGISEIDYWIGDPVLIPPAHGHHFSEKIWRLPRVWIYYAAPEWGPDPVWRPSAEGKICLGSFNQLAKITQQTVSLWARVLQRIPNAYLLLKTKQLDDAANRESVLAAFARHGVSASRIELLGRTADPKDHLSLYCRLDVALDPIGGITGGITTSEALWMGTPVVTLAGPRAGERLTSAILAGIGYDEWAADDEDEYVEKVAQLAANTALREKLRFSLRPTMRGSPFCDPAGMARALEDAFESMFDHWSEHADGMARPLAPKE